MTNRFSDQSLNNSSPSSPSDSSPKPHVVVVGSINMDLVVKIPQIPSPGQTVIGGKFATIPGGKGANQAVAAARCGARVSMVARVGNDDFSECLLAGLRANNVDTSTIMISEAVATGVAIIAVDDNGDNAICVAGGANERLSCADIDEQSSLLAQADVVVLQMEIPQDTVVYALELAHFHKKPVVLNPAPAPTSVHPIIYEADVLIPNQDETACLCGEPAHDVHSAKLAGAALLAKGAKHVVVTLGKRGALALTKEQRKHFPPFAVKIVDTTGAGDAFCGAFAVEYARHRDIFQATRFASAAGALACTRFGAQPAMPLRHEVELLMKRSC